MKEKHKEMGEEPISKLLLKFSLPAMVGMFVNALYNIVDRIYIGNIPEIGPNAIAGVGVVFPIMIISIGFCLLIGMGGATNISISLGQKQKDSAEKYLGNATFLAIIFGLILTFITIFSMDLYITKLGTSPITEPYARDYLTIVALGFPFLMAGYVTNAAVRSDGNPKISMITLLLGAITNIILDPIFIFWMGLGVKGAAIATIISQIVSAIWTICYFNSKWSGIKLHFKNLALEWSKVKNIFIIGAGPFVLQMGSSVVTLVLNSSLMKYGGDIAVGAMTIVNAVNTFILMPIFGINQGVQPILGFNYGARKYHRVREAFILAVKGAITISTLGFLTIQLLSKYFIVIFTSNPELLNAASNGLRIFTLMFPVVGFQIIAAVYFQAIGKPKTTMFLSLSRQFIFLIPIVLLFSRLWGVKGIWMAVPCTDILSVVVTFIMTKRELNNLKILEKEEDLRIDVNK
ncbi:MATE family efflux transporter [Cetobacterium sp. 8H]|uniref:MATE family efflux transporter n=1 Tax=Cetobacterium sp. 8H TaxID=2759681 RepID=UPI00163C6666|nr:MATE family efflux transporter [Cetobacterium sp. 8H]MBC2850189.1 MATE family efflux transporter [Cetobacterium sp. 8H]